jgi:hypothetical protein
MPRWASWIARLLLLDVDVLWSKGGVCTVHRRRLASRDMLQVSRSCRQRLRIAGRVREFDAARQAKDGNLKGFARGDKMEWS